MEPGTEQLLLDTGQTDSDVNISRKRKMTIKEEEFPELEESQLIVSILGADDDTPSGVSYKSKKQILETLPRKEEKLLCSYVGLLCLLLCIQNYWHSISSVTF